MNVPGSMEFRKNEASMNFWNSSKAENDETESMDVPASNKNEENKERRTNVLDPSNSETKKSNLKDVLDLSKDGGKKTRKSIHQGSSQSRETKGKNKVDSDSSKSKKSKAPNSKAKKKTPPPLTKMVLRSHTLAMRKAEETEESGALELRNSGKKELYGINSSRSSKNEGHKGRKSALPGSSKSKQNKDLKSKQNKDLKSKQREKKERKKSTHPPVSQMVLESIRALNDPNGSALVTIRKYMGEHYDVNKKRITPYVVKFLKTSVEKGILQQFGKGAVAKFKIKGATGKK